MKKILVLTLFTIISLPFFATEVSLSNTFGGNTSQMEGSDLFENKSFNFNDRLQFDFETPGFDGRLRLDYYNIGQNHSAGNFLFKGYTQLKFPYINCVVGNSFFSKFQFKSGTLYALDTVPNYARLLKSGIGLYSEIPFDKKNKIKLKLGSTLTGDYVFGGEDFSFDAGAEFIYKNLFSIGVNGRNITALDFGKYAAFGGTQTGDFKFNAGFAYNNTDIELLPAETKYSLTASVLYKNKKNGISSGWDLVSGLNSQFLAGGSHTTKNYSNNAVPFMTAASCYYKILPDLEAGIILKYSDMLGSKDSWTVLINPAVEYKFLNDCFTLNSGVKIKMYSLAEEPATSFAVPLSIKAKISKKL